MRLRLRPLQQLWLRWRRWLWVQLQRRLCCRCCCCGCCRRDSGGDRCGRGCHHAHTHTRRSEYHGCGVGCCGDCGSVTSCRLIAHRSHRCCFLLTVNTRSPRGPVEGGKPLARRAWRAHARAARTAVIAAGSSLATHRSPLTAHRYLPAHCSLSPPKRSGPGAGARANARQTTGGASASDRLER